MQDKVHQPYRKGLVSALCASIDASSLTPHRADPRSTAHPRLRHTLFAPRSAGHLPKRSRSHNPGTGNAQRAGHCQDDRWRVQDGGHRVCGRVLDCYAGGRYCHAFVSGRCDGREKKRGKARTLGKRETCLYISQKVDQTMASAARLFSTCQGSRARTHSGIEASV